MQQAEHEPIGARDTGAGSWTGFLIMAFVVVGLVGALATFAAQIPFERALARDAALDHLLTAPDSSTPPDALREALGDSAQHVLGDAAGLKDRVSQERARMLQAFGQESEDFGFRLRIVIAVFTAAAALFGVAILSVVRRAARL